jgi:regulator of nonsense transcripts 3
MSDQAKGRSGGVLPVNAAARKNAVAQSGSKGSARLPAPRLRLIIRRLPPGLTETEFWIALGDDWKVGSGKVDWAAFKDGKISKE